MTTFHRLLPVPTLLRHVVPALCAALTLAGCTVIPTTGGRPGQTSPAPAATPVPSTPRPTLPAPTPTPSPAPSQVPGATVPSPAITAGLIPGPSLEDVLPRDAPRTALALRAFRASCPSLQRRTDGSGFTSGSDWQAACAAAASWSEDNARNFFLRYFEANQLGDGKTYVTGYFEPEIDGCRTKAPGCETPLYKRPGDLIEVDLGLFSDGLKGRRIRGKVKDTSFIPYDERGAIITGSLAGRAPELAYA